MNETLNPEQIEAAVHALLDFRDNPPEVAVEAIWQAIVQAHPRYIMAPNGRDVIDRVNGRDNFEEIKAILSPTRDNTIVWPNKGW